MQPQSLRPMAALAIAAACPVQALDLNDQLSVTGMLAPTLQCQEVSARLPAEGYGTPLDANGEPLEEAFEGDPPGGFDDTLDSFDDTCRGAMPFQLGVSYRPDDRNEFFVLLGFAVDNGLNPVSPWGLAPWAADLEDDVEDINGRDRDYLLAAWYRYQHPFANGGSLGATVGIIDSTAYLDGNAYANDEYSQFMNEVFVNSGSYGLPSYDAGGALELDTGPWSLKAVGMNIGENDDGENFNFWAIETGYRLESALGTGNYRVILAGTSSAFLDEAGTGEERRFAGGVSLDQAFGEVVGGFLRLAWQQEDAAVDYKALYSGGLDFRGSGWGREEDNIGIGYAYLDGGNLDVDRSHVAEVYYRAVLNEYVALTADVQYMKDDLIEADPRQEDPDGWIFGLRLTAEF